MFHDWDYRRGLITTTAFKRMYENLETYSAISADTQEPPQKRQRITAEIPFLPEETEKIQDCLLSLCEEDTCQEEKDVQQLILNQQQQQYKLKKAPAPLNSRSETQTENATTTNRDVRITRFNPGFEQQTEYELACAFNRPMRTYKEDSPYYPWLPIEPKVNFHLNFTG